MSVTKPIVLDETLQHTNKLLAMMVEEHLEETANLHEIAEVVKKGLAQDVFSVGDQLIIPWSDGTTEYQVPMDIVHFGDVTLKDGEVVPGMWLQWHFCSPFGIPFDANEAFYYAKDGLSAGTYYFTAKNSWGSNIVENESYSFTLANPVPAGGQLVLTTGTVDTAFVNWMVYSYASSTSNQAIETVALAKSASGTYLGDWSSSTKYSDTGVNNMQRSNYGYNRWSQSSLRQFLNSDADKGAWWNPQNVFDRAPSELNSYRGFMAGFKEDFLSILKPIKVTTALNTVSDTDIGVSEDTYDTFFVPSLEQIYANPQWRGEGDYWEYWKQKVGRTTPMDQYVTYPEARTFAINAKTSAQYVRLRSASRNRANNAWYVGSSGYVGNGSATAANRFAPACVIC